MAYSLAFEPGAEAGYAQLLSHLRQAQSAASRLEDRAAVALIETLERLCLARAGDVGAAEVRARAVGGAAPTLSVYLLGDFRAYLNGRGIVEWRKKSERVFKFLVCQRGAAVHRDQLLDAFWPDAEPQAARNCLNVTLHGLRRCLEELGGPAPASGFVQFADGCYRLGEDLQVWCDTDVFEQQVRHGRAAASSDVSRAIAHYELADVLYQGDFLRDDRYEEWAIGTRERLRTTYLAMLGHLGQLLYDTGRYAQAIACAQKILERDDCHEEAHRQIMHSYSAMGQRALGLRQYALCRETLARELGVPPTEETERLAEEMRER
ncbi:MAG TPA: BTAD domain-containing putative transcriptional regulator [Roseiflexaceae bacterium]|nr:BTAD domain-containing putative transcriptional regulator [Roseiflexaceae bacterium]